MSFEHVESPHARRILVAGDKPSHQALDFCYHEALAAVEDDELNPILDWDTIDARWAALLKLAPGCTVAQRTEALRQFYQV